MSNSPRAKRANGNGKRLATQQSVNAAIKAICDVMRRSNCAGAMQYVPELTWIVFLRILDEREAREAIEAKGLDLKAVNPNAKDDTDKRTPDELLDIIETKGREITEALAALRKGRD